MYIGYVVMGVGALLLVLNGMAAPMDHPDTNRSAGLIGVGILLVGILIQVLLYATGVAK